MDASRKSLITIILLVFSILAVSGCTTDETSEIVIGYNTDMNTTALGFYGISGRQGFELAVEEINAAGGILGKRIKPVILDTKYDLELTKNNTEQLVFEDKALAAFGPTNIEGALYAIELMQNNEVINFQHMSTVSEMTTKYEDRPRNYIFRTIPIDEQFTRLEVAWAIKETNNGKIGILYMGLGYGQQGLKDLTEAMRTWGKAPVYTDSFMPTISGNATSVPELTEKLEKFKEAGADAILIHSLGVDTASVLIALEDVDDYDPVLIGSAASLSPELPKLAGELASNLTFPTGIMPDTNELSMELYQKIIDKYGSTPVFAIAASTYDSTYLLKAAIERAGTLDRKAVRDALENIENVQGVVKLYDNPFSRTNHEAFTPEDLYLVHWVDGKVVRIPGGETSEFEIR